MIKKLKLKVIEKVLQETPTVIRIVPVNINLIVKNKNEM